ncbi:hypothetical protein G6O67_004189 [Ophiocordyceps sinensis]|uniref:Lipoprotein n=3 Tax=Ophiocordyceps sinensis TaxID=72228 RepID=A0A8H4LY39_9HYPO|nr:hypothetical protein G6O67_004189 [Ophiocordyceps sinensis]
MKREHIPLPALTLAAAIFMATACQAQDDNAGFVPACADVPAANMVDATACRASATPDEAKSPSHAAENTMQVAQSGGQAIGHYEFTRDTAEPTAIARGGFGGRSHVEARAAKDEKGGGGGWAGGLVGGGKGGKGGRGG